MISNFISFTINCCESMQEHNIVFFLLNMNLVAGLQGERGLLCLGQL